jgi:hypothetical protein
MAHRHQIGVGTPARLNDGIEMNGPRCFARRVCSATAATVDARSARSRSIVVVRSENTRFATTSFGRSLGLAFIGICIAMRPDRCRCSVFHRSIPRCSAARRMSFTVALDAARRGPPRGAR